jgi:hypothetical protein
VEGTGAQCRDEIRNLRPSLPPSASSSATCWDSCESRMAPGSNTIGIVSARRTRSSSRSGTSSCMNETNSNGDSTAHGRTSPVSTNVARRNCSPTVREESGSRLACNADQPGRACRGGGHRGASPTQRRDYNRTRVGGSSYARGAYWPSTRAGMTESHDAALAWDRYQIVVPKSALTTRYGPSNWATQRYRTHKRAYIYIGFLMWKYWPTIP